MADEQFTLLLVDDNPTNLTLLAKIIELDLPQVRVLTAGTGMEGLELAAREQIDGAFIDVQMPEMSGLEMCRRLKAEPRTAGMPLVLITAHLASPMMRAEGLEVGAYDFISQPISNVEMLARIKVMLRLCQGERVAQDNRQMQPVASADSTHLRWLSGLLLSGNGKLTDADHRLLQSLASKVGNGDRPEESLLLGLLGTKFPQPWQQTFLTLALLDSFPLALATKLSEIEDLEATFDYLQRHDLILAQNTVADQYRFKDTVKRELLSCAEQAFSKKERQQICLLAADWYQQKSNPLAAFRCLLQSELYPAISQLLSQEGLALLEDRYQPEFEHLLAQVPEDEAVGCGWLALYTGIGFIRSQPLDADTWLELARNRFVVAKDQRGELLTLSQQVIEYLVADGQVDFGISRLPRLRELAKQHLDLLTPYNRLNVLFSLAMGELFFASDLKRCEELLTQGMGELVREKQLGLQVAFSLLQTLLGIFQGRFRVARAAMERAREASIQLPRESFPTSVFHVIACELFYATGELDSFDRYRGLVRRFWRNGEFRQSALWPVHTFFASLNEMAQGNAAAEELLEVALLESPSASRPHLQSWLIQLRGFLHAQAGRVDSARCDCAKGLELRGQVAIDLHRLPNLLLAGATSLLLEDHLAAKELLQEGLAASIQLDEGRYRGGFHAWLAALHIAENDKDSALEQLGQMFDLLRRQRANFFFGLTPELLKTLVPLAVTDIEWNPQLQQLVEQRLNCRVDESGRLVPLAQLQTLGGYQFVLQGKNCDLSKVGQSSRQLLALLAVAPNCSLSSELAMGTLWPDSPASKARNSFDTALSRLRKALEMEFGKQIRQDYLILEKGMLLLRNLRIDIVEFTRELEASRRHLQRRNFWQAESAFWRADPLWGGKFLSGFELEAELPYRYEQYNQLRLEQLEGLARLLIQRGDLPEAARILQAGIAFDPTHDGLVQKLLDIYRQQQEARAARQLLENYRKALRAEEYDEQEIDELITTLSPQRLEV